MSDDIQCILCRIFLFYNKENVTNAKYKELFEEHMSEEHQCLLNGGERLGLVQQKIKVEEDSIEQGNIQLRIISNEVNKIETKEKNNVDSDHDKGVDGEGSLAEKNLPNNSSGYKCTICFKAAKSLDSHESFSSRRFV